MGSIAEAVVVANPAIIPSPSGGGLGWGQGHSS